ncbi:MAG: BatA domain-containing protein [Lewinellaceae bacterium]|nr:BatA and WFA domain-containing protein [Saprospiraceae bacterium]MCB9271429.1 BatA domain-containing protein [Lewinellaceae bacterium]HPG08838.1 BatA and WFA domain-containing protein [Saprospiraceae bacterium]HPQ98255.1 BatA and WFA domain-containing protein [Saprospiraceae bacterium]
MQFVFPSFLWAFALLSIPVIIHLFYFRRFRKVYFTNVRFLREVKDETSSRNKLKNLLVLLARILMASFLILTFAQPFIPLNNRVDEGRKAVSIYVDNSFSMKAQSSDVPLLDKAKSRAREIVNGYQESDQFQIITNDFEGRHQRFFNKEDILPIIDEITYSPRVKDMKQVIERQEQLFTQARQSRPVSYLISDFQDQITNLPPNPDTSFHTNLIPIQSVQEKNVAIDSCWFGAPVHVLGQNNPLYVRIRNYGDQPVEAVRLSVIRNEQEQPMGSSSIAANASVVDTINIQTLESGWHEMVVKISDYPVTFDDTYFLTFDVAQQVRILLLYANLPDRYLQAALAGLQNFQVTAQSAQNIAYSEFGNYQLIILQDLPGISSGLGSALRQYLENTGNVLIFPAHNIDLQSYNDFLQAVPAGQLFAPDTLHRQVARINTEEFIYNNVFERIRPNLRLPETNYNFGISRASRAAEEPLLAYRDGSAYLMKYRVGAGQLYLSAAPINPDDNNLVNQPEVFVPLLFKSALANAESKEIAYWIGGNHTITMERQSGSDAVFVIRGAQEWIPKQTTVGNVVYLDTEEEPREAGFYEVLWDNTPQAKLAFNFDRKESDLSIIPVSELKDRYGSAYTFLDDAQIADFSKYIRDQISGISLWRYCLWLVLFFLALEVLILRFWKT